MAIARTNHHKVLVIGGGTAGLTATARLLRAKVADVAVIEPSDKHYYQPLWTLVGGGLANVESTVRSSASVIPRGASWIRDAAIGVDPENNQVELKGGAKVSYDYAIVAPGIQLDWHKIEGLTATLGANAVSSNYGYDLAPKTWENIRTLRSGTAIFNMPTGAIKCAGAPQKIAYLACDYWQRQGVLKDIHVILILPGAAIFGVPEFAKPLLEVVKRYGIDVRFQSELTAIDHVSRTAVVRDISGANSAAEEIHFDMAHVVPPQSAPDWIKDSKLADPTNPAGYVDIDKNLLVHKRYPNIFSLGDAGSSPNSKTGAAIRKQAPVVVANLLAAMSSQPLGKSYDGYASCPLVTSHNRCIMAEFDYAPKPTPTFPILDMQKERYDMFLVKRYGLPIMYWHFMLKGLA